MITDDEMWKLVRAAGLLTAVPGTQKWENALFAYGRACAVHSIKPAQDVAPWPDFLGQPIHHGHRLVHPSDGSEFTAVRLNGHEDEGDAWRAIYDDGAVSRLCLQIGDKGQAVLAQKPATAGKEGVRPIDDE